MAIIAAQLVTLPQIEPNSRVRLVGDPTRIGVATDGRRSQRQRSLILVIFPDRSQWVPEEQLELVTAGGETPTDLLLSRKLGTAFDLRRVITHVRLTGRLADVIYSMEATNTDFFAYQFKPVLKLLYSPANGILIADEVGLGKTIEAGLIWTELRSRFDMKRLMVICPAVLREKWQSELASKIGVRADLVDAKEAVRTLRDPLSGARGFAMIGSVQGLRPGKQWEDEEEDKSHSAQLARLIQSQENEEPLFDLLIVDEAHYLRNSKTQSHELGELIRKVSEYAVFLTATPIHNRNDDLFSLLNILDPDTFQRQDDFGAVLEANRPLVKARDCILSPNGKKGEILELLAEENVSPLLRNNRQLDGIRKSILSDDFSEPEIRSHIAYRLETVNLLGHVVTRTRKRDVNEWRVIREVIPESIPIQKVERDFYDIVTEEVIQYSLNCNVNERFLLATPQRQMTSCMPAALKAWQRRRIELDPYDGDEREEVAESLMGPLTRQLVERSNEMVSLSELIAHDSKFDRLSKILRHFFSEHPEEKVVLFSTFRATLSYLKERLDEIGISNISLTGEYKGPKDEVIQAFRAPDGPSVLLSSEVGGEGVDLQFSRMLVNYDLPWNPMRVEQRIGRIDRLGQRSEKVLIWNLFYEDTIDSRIYERLYDKLGLCQSALGDFDAILGDQIRHLTRDLLSGELSPEQQNSRIDQTAQALATLRQEEERLEQNASELMAYGDYILNQVRAAKDLHRWITSKDLETYVNDFLGLHYTGCVVRQNTDAAHEFDISLSQEAKHELAEYIRKERISTPTRLTYNSPEPIHCRFENKISGGIYERAEIVSQFHPLVRFASSELERRGDKLRPAVAISISGDGQITLPGPGTYVVSASLWSVGGLQETEKLVFRAKQLSLTAKELTDQAAEQLAMRAALDGENWLEARNTVDFDLAYEIANDHLFGGLLEDFEKFIEEINAQNNDRIDFQERTLERHLKNQTLKLNEVREKHRLAGRQSLIRATEGRIRALHQRVDRQLLAIKEKREITNRNEEICVALVQVR